MVSLDNFFFSESTAFSILGLFLAKCQHFFKHKG